MTARILPFNRQRNPETDPERRWRLVKTTDPNHAELCRELMRQTLGRELNTGPLVTVTAFDPDAKFVTVRLANDDQPGA